MTNEQDGPTPRTDAAIVDWQATEEDCVYADFARQLERELADERARADDAEAELQTIAALYAGRHPQELSSDGRYCQGAMLNLAMRHGRTAHSRRAEPKGETNAGAVKSPAEALRDYDQRKSVVLPDFDSLARDESPAPTMQPAYDHGIDRAFMDALERGEHLKPLEGERPLNDAELTDVKTMVMECTKAAQSSPGPDAMPADAHIYSFPVGAGWGPGFAQFVSKADYDALRRHAEGLASKLEVSNQEFSRVAQNYREASERAEAAQGMHDRLHDQFVEMRDRWLRAMERATATEARAEDAEAELQAIAALYKGEHPQALSSDQRYCQAAMINLSMRHGLRVVALAEGGAK